MSLTLQWCRQTLKSNKQPPAEPNHIIQHATCWNQQHPIDGSKNTQHAVDIQVFVCVAVMYTCPCKPQAAWLVAHCNCGYLPPSPSLGLTLSQ